MGESRGGERVIGENEVERVGDKTIDSKRGGGEGTFASGVPHTPDEGEHNFGMSFVRVGEEEEEVIDRAPLEAVRKPQLGGNAGESFFGNRAVVVGMTVGVLSISAEFAPGGISRVVAAQEEPGSPGKRKGPHIKPKKGVPDRGPDLNLVLDFG